MRHETYIYLDADKKLGQKIPFYYDHLKKVQKLGYASLYNWLVASYAETGSQARTASILGVDQCTIGNWLRRAGIPTNPRGGANNVKEKKI
jgi:hypothetical protein